MALLVVPLLVVVAGPSGAGKGTLVRRLLARDPQLWLSVSANTRAPRPDEEEGRDYHFVSRDEFERMRDAGELLEWFEVYDDLKGTPRAPVERRLAAGGDVLLELDVQGAMAVRDVFPDAVLIFVKPPSRDEQRRRLLDRHRGDPGVDEASLRRRLAAAEAEEARADAFDYVVVNDDVDRAAEQVAAILAGLRTGR